MMLIGDEPQSYPSYRDIAVLDDFSRYIIAWKLCATMKAEDVVPHWTWR
jgi:transposase InsO family protein